MTAGKEKENPGESDPFAGISGPAGEAKLLPLKSDLIFKMVFGDARYIEILRAFLLAALDIPADDLADIRIIDPHLERDTPDDKLGILDVRVQMRGGGLVAVEIQRRRVPAMAERVTFSTCRNLSRQIVHGQGYAKIAKVVTIVITDYDMIPGEKEEKRYHHVFRLYDETHRTRLTDVVEIHTLELGKLPPASETGFVKDGELLDWLRLIRTEDREEIEMLATKTAEMGMAVGRLKQLSADEATRLRYEARELYLMDEMARNEAAFAEGEAKGREEEKTALARNALQMGMSIGDISRLTGFSEREISSLIH